MVTGRAIRCNRGKSTWTFRHCAWKPAKRSVMVWTDGIQMIESFLQTEVAQVIGAEFVAQEMGELFILFEKGVLPVSAEHMVAVLDLIDDGSEFSVEPLV